MVDFTKFRIDLQKDVTLHRFVGSGAFAEVWKGTYNDKTVAVKILNKGVATTPKTRYFFFSWDMPTPNDNCSSSMCNSDSTTSLSEQKAQAMLRANFQEFRREVRTMSIFQYSNLVEIIGFAMPHPMAMIMEFVPYGNLYSFLHSPSTLDWPLRLRINIDIAKGLAFLHNTKPPLVHRDIKSPNIMVCIGGSGR